MTLTPIRDAMRQLNISRARIHRLRLPGGRGYEARPVLVMPYRGLVTQESIDALLEWRKTQPKTKPNTKKT